MRVSTHYLIWSGLAGLSACAAVEPHTLQTPWVSRRGETELALNTGLHGSDLQAAHALTDRVTLLGSYHQRVLSGRGSWTYQGEAGAGRTWGRSAGQTLGVYGGLGYGTGQSGGTLCLDLCGSVSSYRVGYGYAYVQPTYRWRPDASSGFSTAVKVMLVDFRRLEKSTYYPDNFLNDSVRVAGGTVVQSRAGYGSLVLQPGFSTFREIAPHLRLTFSGSLYIPLRTEFPSVMPFAVGLGVQYHFGGAAATADQP
ncbi:hypothetical protein [Hymenobacter persicinus]|uniref:Outer membrane protein beta-barrel domain-containing protein n=1 Tax=Hymenobacter persicinus TaxID=2025506 RepID=A0A4Q5LFM8_9BACT|nr:hypothetical protein [Hymenobacter persicinus]RYU83763.1 hypothetical protein EWM57_02120 [Hymenobacter persicinus]